MHTQQTTMSFVQIIYHHNIKVAHDLQLQKNTIQIHSNKFKAISICVEHLLSTDISITSFMLVLLYISLIELHHSIHSWVLWPKMNHSSNGLDKHININ